MSKIKQAKPEVLFFPGRWMEKLDAIRRYPLTFLEAPSGFGKTTALRHFFNTAVSEATPVHWHTVSGGRTSASWRAFCEMIRSFDPENGERLLELDVPDVDTMPLITELFRELKCTQETYLIIDDFAVWQLPLPCAFLHALSAHGGKELHIAVASQPLPRKEQSLLIPSSRLCLLQESVLAFSEEDIDTYYRQAGVSLLPRQLTEVTEITEGWIMALYLQLLSFIENQRFESGSLSSLMQNALWTRLPEKEQLFLLSVSIFPRFSLSQATALSGISPAETEKLLQEKRVFVHYDKESRSFYLHSLFQVFLGEQFALLPDHIQKDIYLAGGALAEQAGDRLHTLRFYYHSGVWERILAMPLSSYEIADVIDETTKPMILDLLDNLPFETKKKYPAAMVPLAFTLFFMHENQKLMAMQEEIHASIAESDLPQRQKDALFGEIELLLSFMEYNRIDAMSERHRKALTLLKGPATLINSKSTWTFGSPSVLYLFYRESGKLAEALTQMDECMPVYYALTGGHGSGAESIMRAEALFLNGKMEEAEILCHRSILTADSQRQNSICQCALFLLSRIALFRGDKSLLHTSLAALEKRSRQNTEDLCRYTLDLARGYLLVLMHKKEDLPLWLKEGEINDQRLVIMIQPFAYISYGRILLEEKAYLKLIGVCQYMLGISSIFPNLLSQLYAKLYLAQAFWATGKAEDAQSALQEALDLAMPDGLYMPFAENYSGIQALLSSMMGYKEDCQQIVALAEKLMQGLDTFCSPQLSLTPREWETIELLRQGMSNKEIAAELFISVNTVKTMLRRLYEKTGVSSKTQLAMLDFGEKGFQGKL